MEFHQMRDCDAWRKHGLKMTTDSNECNIKNGDLNDQIISETKY